MPRVVVLLLFLVQGGVHGWGTSKTSYLNTFDASHTPLDPCYDDLGPGAKKCVPDFVNAAYGKGVVASETCGTPPNRYCLQQKGKGHTTRSCNVCDAADPGLAHPTAYLTDLNNPGNLTCWMSPPIEATGGHRNVSVTLSLGKKYELTYVSLQFCGTKPDSIAILKSTDFGKNWQPFQYYSSQCRKVYGIPNRFVISKSNEQEALCTDAHLTQTSNSLSSRIAFSTLEGRPSAIDFDSSPVLQDWITVTDIKVVFNRLHPLDKENDLEARFEPYVFAVADLSVGGRCKCNGHASKCAKDENGELACECAHNTGGRECEKCKPFYFDRPWGRATDKEAHECVRKYCSTLAAHTAVLLQRGLSPFFEVQL